MIRTGKESIEGLRDDREVWMNGERIAYEERQHAGRHGADQLNALYNKFNLSGPL